MKVPSSFQDVSSQSERSMTSVTINPLRDRSHSWTVTTSTQLPNSYALQSHVMDIKSKIKLQKEMNKAINVIQTFLSPALLKDQSIPRELLIEAQGLVFLTVYKVGFLLSGNFGNGFIISRTTGGWSAPSFLTSGGLGFGMMAGGEVVNYMIILSSRSAVKVFTRNGQLQLGSELDLAIGPIGRATSAALNVGRGGIAPNYSYSHCKGLYGGIGLSSAVICTRKSLNAKFYGTQVTTRQILGGEVSCPLAVPLWQALDRALNLSRIYVDGFPAMDGSPLGITCSVCKYVNPMGTLDTCLQCQNLLVYTVGIHSGKRSAGQLIVTDESSDISQQAQL